MIRLSSLSKSIAAAGCAGVLCACTSVTAVKDVTSDSPAYMAKKFSVASLSTSVGEKVPMDAITSTHDGVTLVSETNQEMADGKKEAWTSLNTFTKVGQGLYQRTTENSNNGIPYQIMYDLAYRGILDLRWQAIPLRGAVSGHLYEVKKATRFDPMPTKVGDEFIVEYLAGTEEQIANYGSYKRSCKVARQLPAEEVHAKLTGTVLALECENTWNNTLQNRSKWFFFQNYGVAFQTELTSSIAKTVTRITDVKS